MIHDDGVRRYKNQNVAIKIVHKGDTPEEVIKRQGRFLREVTMLSRVQHKNLVKVRFFADYYHSFHWLEVLVAFGY